MKPSDIIKQVCFMGGDECLASVQIRTIQIARHLGCDFLVNDRLDLDLLKDKKLFILTKSFGINRQRLRERGKVVIDIIDLTGIPTDVDGYLVSSVTASRALTLPPRPIFVIPHHHCNFSNIPNPIRNPKIACYIGSWLWYPAGLLPSHTPFLDIQNFESLMEAYRRADVLLNFRRPAANNSNALCSYRANLVLKAGIKLINALAFGIPSISSDEPVYREIAPECTIFSTFESCEEDLRHLQENPVLYEKLRANCIARAGEFSIEMIGKKYVAAFESLLG